MVGASKVSRYNYQAETLSNDKKVVLRRPARLKGGFDFVVRVPEHNFSSSGLRRRFEPKHDDIIQDLTKKKEIDACAYSALYEKLTDIFECRNVLDSEIAPLTQLPGLPNDLIIKVLKWLFIEQDIRYWNYSGRNKLWSYFPRR